ncbi:hypothetical protein Tco_1462844, partial [Tanacetum coccineum]
MYHKKNVDYAYLLWEDFVYQVENKNVKRSNEMYYPRFTTVIVNFFMTKDQSIPRRNKANWHFARDDLMFTTIKVVSRHEDTQLYGVILPIDLTNEAIKDLESYKEYYAIASGAEPPKTKASVKKKQVGSDTAKTPPAAKGKRLKTIAKRISSDEDDDAESENDNDNDDTNNQDDEEQGDDDAQTDSDNDGDDFVHPKFSTHDEEDKEEDSFDPRVQRPSHVESTKDEDSDEEIQGANVEGDKHDEEETNEEVEENELYRDMNVNLEGQDIEMTNAQKTNSSSVSSSLISNMLNPSPDTGIDSIFNLNTELTYLVVVLVTAIAEPRLLSVTTTPPPPTPLNTHLFDHRLKTLENNFSEFNQTNQFVAAVSSILNIFDAYLANKMHEAVKTAIQLQFERLRDEAQAENKDFINKLDDNIKKI